MTYDSTNPEHRASLAEAIAKYEHFLATVPREQVWPGSAIPFGMEPAAGDEETST